LIIEQPTKIFGYYRCPVKKGNSEHETIGQKAEGSYIPVHKSNHQKSRIRKINENKHSSNLQLGNMPTI
jgi:hypothetical protein